ncbi:hypothetical protein DV737_g4418, partial [Chaetothyriales sp. CBS 132003]
MAAYASPMAVVIERYLSEGGFAHVYVVQLPRPVDGSSKAVLKRVAVPDKEHLANMRTEVETMKKLRGQNEHIVKYIDSHASQLKGGGYEVFLLMEFCQGGGLIDFMNTRLQNRLTEPEILAIFTDIAEGVACMHYLRPPLLHRDLKVENVLISTEGTRKMFKLCDFGSTAPPRPAASSAAEARLIDDDIQRHTTLQYRSPEMIDVYRKLPIDEKSDIWALGVFLYKLCYYTTPFEEVGQMAILNAKFKYPAYPRFSDQIKLLIATMLREKPSERPDIFQVLQKACQLTKRELPFRDIYSNRSRSEGGKALVSPTSPNNSQPHVGATLATLAPAATKKDSLPVPQVEPMRRGRPPSDDFSSKFPTLDEFSLMTDPATKFHFDAGPDTTKPDAADAALAQRVTNALADEAFGRSSSPPKAQSPAIPAKASSLIDGKRSLERSKDLHPPTAIPAAAPQRPSAMVVVSAGTITSPAPTPPPAKPKPVSDRPIWKVPQADSPRAPALAQRSDVSLAAEANEQSRLARLLREDAWRSQSRIPDHDHARSPTSSRPSLEGGRPTVRDVGRGLTRTRSLNLRSRPASVNIGKGAATDIKDPALRHADYGTNFVSAEPAEADSSAVERESESNTPSAVDFLKELEGDERDRRAYHKRLSSGSLHSKRASLPHIAVSSTKLLAGRFGDAFKIFEGGGGGGENGHRRNSSHARDGDRRNSPSRDRLNALTPIAGSEATDLSEDRLDLAETEDLSPEMRRELEKRQLEAEERRVANAAAAYRQRLGARGAAPAGGVGMQKAASIRSKVQSLLGENARPVQKTAAGYGKYTDEQHPTLPQPVDGQLTLAKTASNPAPVPPKPAVATAAAAAYQVQAAQPQHPATAPTVASRQPRPDRPASPDDWETKFNQRYPRLSGIEMVETAIDTSERPPVKVREV